jgi:hypothetical protein
VARYTWAKQGDPRNIGDTSVSINRISLWWQSTVSTEDTASTLATPSFWDRTLSYMDCLVKEVIGIRLNNKNFNRDGGLMLSHAWHPVINMLSNKKAGLMQQALDTNQQLPLASTPS